MAYWVFFYEQGLNLLLLGGWRTDVLLDGEEAGRREAGRSSTGGA